MRAIPARSGAGDAAAARRATSQVATSQAQHLREAIAVELTTDGSGRGLIGNDSSRRVIAERLMERLTHSGT